MQEAGKTAEIKGKDAEIKHLKYAVYPLIFACQDTLAKVIL